MNSQLFEKFQNIDINNYFQLLQTEYIVNNYFYFLLGSIFILFYSTINKIFSQINFLNNKINYVMKTDDQFEEIIDKYIKNKSFKEKIKDIINQENKIKEIDSSIKTQLYNNDYSTKLIHKGVGAFFISDEDNSNNVSLKFECKGEHTGFRNNDVLYFQGGSHKKRSHLYILVTSTTNGKIDTFEWSFGNKSNIDTSISRNDDNKFGKYSGYPIYIGRKERDSNKIILNNNLMKQFTQRKCWFNEDYLHNNFIPNLITNWTVIH